MVIFKDCHTRTPPSDIPARNETAGLMFRINLHCYYCYRCYLRGGCSIANGRHTPIFNKTEVLSASFADTDVCCDIYDRSSFISCPHYTSCTIINSTGMNPHIYTVYYKKREQKRQDNKTNVPDSAVTKEGAGDKRPLSVTSGGRTLDLSVE